MSETLSLEQAVESVIKRLRLLGISFHAETYGEMFVTATLERNHRDIPGHKGQVSIMALAGDFMTALASAEKLLEKVNILELALGSAIEPPEDKEQPHENGYARKYVKDDIQVEFKRQGKRFVITDINRRDAEGFYIHEQPVPLQGKMKFVKKLDKGLELWEWNDIGILTGTAGECIVREGMIIKSRTTMMS